MTKTELEVMDDYFTMRRILVTIMKKMGWTTVNIEEAAMTYASDENHICLDVPDDYSVRITLLDDLEREVSFHDAAMHFHIRKEDDD